MWRQNEKAKEKRTEIKFKSLLSNCIHETLTKRPGWKETDKDDWDFIWADKDWIRMHLDEVTSQEHNPRHFFKHSHKTYGN
jgi:hypothetical protein